MNLIIYELNGAEVGQCRQDGYLNLTKMAQASSEANCRLFKARSVTNKRVL